MLVRMSGRDRVRWVGGVSRDTRHGSEHRAGDREKPTVGSGHREVAEPTVLRRLRRRGAIRARNQWNPAPHGATLIAECAAVPGKLALSGDAVSEPQRQWRCAQIRANPSPQPNSREQGNFQGISRLHQF
jgi:hypothetical protein